MPNVLFISEAEIKDSTLVDKDVDIQYIRALIIEQQEIKIQSLVGTSLYNELKDQIDTDTVTALNKTLLDDYLQPALRNYVIAESPLYLNFKLTNKNVSSQGENSTPLSFDDTLRLSKELENKAEWYAERATKYLCENSNDYPLFSNPGTGQDIIKPNVTNYTSGMWLGDGRERPNKELGEHLYDRDWETRIMDSR